MMRVGVPDRGDHAFAGAHVDQLLAGGDQRGLGLQAGIGEHAGDRDLLHLGAETGEAAELVEQRAAPEPDVGIVRQLVLVGAQLKLRIGAVLVEIFRDDAVLQHAAEREREAARRPGQPLGHGIIGGKHQGDAERERDQAAPDAGARGMRRRSNRNSATPASSSASSTASVALWVAADTAMSSDQRDALAAAERLAAQQQQIERQHAKPGENIGEQDRGQPGQGGDRPTAPR